jgi:hypothetical protein
MTTVDGELELAVTHLLWAKELAQLFSHPTEAVQRIDLIKRATAKVRAEIATKTRIT